eukprot:SAG31_NODE_122_length_23797_cov_39.343812_24_plen_63_part_00
MQDMAPAARTAATLTAVPGAFGKLLLFGGHAGVPAYAVLLILQSERAGAFFVLVLQPISVHC